MSQMTGQTTGENRIPLTTAYAAAAPYGIFVAWGEGKNSGQIFDLAAGALAAAPTYENCDVRFEQDAVTGEWILTIPPTLPSNSYRILVRDGAAGAVTSADDDICRIHISWSAESNCLKINKTDLFVGY